MGNFPSYDLKMFLSFKGVDNENGFPHTFLYTKLCVHKTVTGKKKPKYEQLSSHCRGNCW